MVWMWLTVAFAEPPDDAPFEHPFLTEEGQAVLQEARTALQTDKPRMLLRNLDVGGAIIEDEQGWRKEDRVGVAPPHRARVRGSPAGGRTAPVSR